MVAREVSDRDKREYLLSRHFSIEFRRCLRIAARHRDPALREMALERVGALVRTYLTPTLAARLNPRLRVALHFAGKDLAEEMTRAQAEEQDPTPFDIFEEDGRWYALLPYFRDPAVPVPDYCYDVTPGAALEVLPCAVTWRGSTLAIEAEDGAAGLAAEQADDIDLVVRRRAADPQDGRSFTLPVAHEGSRLIANLDVAHLDFGEGAGRWDLYLRAHKQEASRIVRVGLAASQRVPAQTTCEGPDRSKVEVSCVRGRKGVLVLRVGQESTQQRPGLLDRARRLRPGPRS
ncbi:MAG: hypothetical protein L0H31_03055 [Nocardioidaceae bacterium]|nr:hypothetical protein [Nocardioidaceae bacterium]